MNYITASPRKTAIKTQSAKEIEDEHKNLLFTIRNVVGISTLIGLSIFAIYQALQKPLPSPWRNYDALLSTGETIKHQQTKSYLNYTSDNREIDDPEDFMYLSVKKISGKNSVWLTSKNNDFGCIPSTRNSCSIQVSFDGGTDKVYTYQGGRFHTAYIENSDSLINGIKGSQKVTIKGIFTRPNASPMENLKVSEKNGGSYVGTIRKEHTFNVGGLMWK